MPLFSLDDWTHCPKCGGFFAPDTPRSRRCRNCGFVYYLNASAATAAFVLDENDRLLVCRRAKEPARGTLDLPGGFVDPGESIEQGLTREIKEETGCDIATLRFLFGGSNDYCFSNFTVPTADCFFLVTLAPDSTPKGSDDASDMQWIPLSDINPDDFGLHSIAQAVRRFLSTYPIPSSSC